MTPNHPPLRLGLAERVLSMGMRGLLPRALATGPALLERLPAAGDRRAALYLHIPFCETLCPFCSFHRIPFHADLAERYFDALEAEMHLAAGLGYRFETLHVGGGTPTVLMDRLLRVLDLARECFGVKHCSCETHAHHLRPEIAGRLEGRVERLSVGVQSLDPVILKRMRRDRDGFGAEQMLEAIRDMNGRFPTLNVDLIFNLPGQTVAGVVEDLERVLATGVSQVTTYPLMASPKVSRDMRRQFGETSGAQEYAMFCRIEDCMRAHGMRASSPWCYSRCGSGMIDEYIVDAPEYVGLGSGAFSLLGGRLYVNTFSVSRYVERLASGRMSVERMRVFGPREMMHYRLMMGLFGLHPDPRTLAPSAGTRMLLGFELLLLRMAGAFESGHADRLVLSHGGRYLALAMMREFFAGMNHVRDEARSQLPAWQRCEECVS